MSTPVQRPTWIVRVGMAHRRLFASVAIGLATIVVLHVANMGAVARLLIGWDVGVAIYLVAAAAIMASCSTVAAIKKNAAIQDEGAFGILVLAVIAALASLGAIFAQLTV